jgi:hypothetical protein
MGTSNSSHTTQLRVILMYASWEGSRMGSGNSSTHPVRQKRRRYRRRLPEESVRPEVIDPDGMDGVAGWPHLGRSSVLVLGQTRAAVQAAMDKGHGFLRGQIVLFLPPRGLLQVTLGYSQQSWVSFAPRQTWRLVAPPFELIVTGRPKDVPMG